MKLSVFFSGNHLVLCSIPRTYIIWFRCVYSIKKKKISLNFYRSVVVVMLLKGRALPAPLIPFLFSSSLPFFFFFFNTVRFNRNEMCDGVNSVAKNKKAKKKKTTMMMVFGVMTTLLLMFLVCRARVHATNFVFTRGTYRESNNLWWEQRRRVSDVLIKV